VVAVAALASAVVVARPMSGGRVAAAAELVANPAAHQRCVDVQGLRVCTYDRYTELAARAAAAVRPVVAAAGPAHLRGVVFMQLPPHRRDLPVEVVTALHGRVADAAVDDLGPNVHDLGYRSTAAHLAALRLRVAAVAVGAPAEPSIVSEAAVLAGQARGVVMLWLASLGLPKDEARRLAPNHDGPGDPRLAGMSWPTDCGEGGSVIWSRQDFRAARLLMAHDPAVVGRIVQSQWARFTNPSTRTDELLAAVGLAPVGPPDPGIEPAGYSC
jgi:hypothetical protein